MKNNLMTDDFVEPLNGEKSVTVEIHAGDGNLIIDSQVSDAQTLAKGTMQYFDNMGKPVRTIASKEDRVTLSLKGSETGQKWFRLPWAACNGATEWKIHLNPAAIVDLKAHSNGGNVNIDMAGMAISKVQVDTGGGNIDLVLPEKAGDLEIDARTGAGNVSVNIPGNGPARIHATIGLGKTIIDPRFSLVEKNVFQSSDFDSSENKVELILNSGAGNIIVTSRDLP